MRIGVTCSTALVRMLNDRCCRRYTHCPVVLSGDERLLILASNFIDQAAAAYRKVFLSVISFVFPSSVAMDASGLPAWKLTGKAAFGVSHNKQ